MKEKNTKDTLQIGTLQLPVESATKTFAVLAKRGAGKTYTAAVLAEEFFKQGVAARTYLASAFVLIAIFLIITLIGVLRPPGVQPISWLYILLSVLYLPVVAWAWRQESTHTN